MTDKTAEQKAAEWIKNRLEGMATDDQFCPPRSTEVFLAGYEQGKKDALEPIKEKIRSGYIDQLAFDGEVPMFLKQTPKDQE